MNSYSSVVKNKVLKAISDNNMLVSTKDVVVGFSGGADSVCLLHVLFSLREELGIIVKAAHVNHCIRGLESKRDEIFAFNFCSKLGIEFDSLVFNCVEEAHKSGESLEECGRRIRYTYFDELAGVNSKIATAHNANDNAETVIFNLARGSALKGVCGIPCVRGNIIRPLIYCTRQEIEHYCEENNLEFVTDSTNLTDDYTRNNIRHNVLPVLTQINSAAIENITAFCVNARQSEDYMFTRASLLIEDARIESNVYDATLLRMSHIAVLKEAVYMAYQQFSFTIPDRKKIDAIVDLIYNSGRIQLFGCVYAEVVKNRLRFFTRTTGAPLDLLNVPDIGDYDFGDYKITLLTVNLNHESRDDDLLRDLIDCNKIKGKLFLRTRREGDKITLFKRNVSKTLKKLFCEMNVPVEKRDTIPILCDDDGIVWVYGVGTAARCCVDNDFSNIIYIEGEDNG